MASGMVWFTLMRSDCRDTVPDTVPKSVSEIE